MIRLYKIFPALSFLLLNLVLFANNKNPNPNKALPNATIAANTTEVCVGGTNPIITFTGKDGTAPYTFKYTINGGAEQSIKTISGNSVTLTVATNAANSFEYKLVNITDSKNETQPETASIKVNVNAPPVVDFSFNNDNSCSGTAIQFTNTTTGTGDIKYSWDFGDQKTETDKNPSHVFEALGCSSQDFTVKLTATVGGCIVSKTKTIKVKQKPDINFVDSINPFDPFSNCAFATSNPVYAIKVGNASVSAGCVTSYTINWGDGNTQTNASFPAEHTYNLNGAYQMIITANGTNGCVNTKRYIIKNVSNPLGGLNSPGSTQNLCAPTPNLQFSISNWGSNSLDTTYSIDYDDGTPLVVLTQNQLNSSTYFNATTPANSSNFPIPHIYTKSSCPRPSFEVKLYVTNACGTTPFALGNISILSKPDADFSVPEANCVNTNVEFTNKTISGYGQNCVQGSIYTWDFGDGSPILTTGITSPTNINHTYTTPGNYTAILTAQNGCGKTTKTKVICIEKPISPAFTLDKTTGCAPQIITATNTTVATNSCSPPKYSWTVTHKPEFCATTTIFIPQQTTTNGNFNFTEPGTYTIKLTATNSCSPAQSTSQTVTVKSPPKVSLATIPDKCGGVSGTTIIKPTATVLGCGFTNADLVYNWTFPGGTPATSNEISPEVTYSTAGSKTVSLFISVVGGCGNSATVQETFGIGTAPTLNPLSPPNQAICSGSSTVAVPLAAEVGTTFSWSATTVPAGVSFNPTSGSGNTIPALTLSNSTTAAKTVVLTITSSLNGCTSTKTYEIVVNPGPTLTQPVANIICVGGTMPPLTVTVSPAPATGTATYKWYSNDNGNNLVANSVLVNTSTTDGSYLPPSTLGTKYYFCEITFSSAGSCPSIKSETVEITVKEGVKITTQPTASQKLCIGGSLSKPLSVEASGGVGNLSYQWYFNTTNATTGGTKVGTNSKDYTPTVFTTTGTFYYYVEIAATGNGCSPIVSTIAEVVVVNDPTITVQPLATQKQCIGSTATTLTVTAIDGAGTFNYQWYQTTSNTNTGGNLVGTNAPNFVPTTNAIGTFYYYCIVSQTGLGCGVKSEVAKVEVLNAPTFITQPQPQSVCKGSPLNALSVAFTNGTGTATYQWFDSKGKIDGAIAATYTPTNTETTSIYCIISFSEGGCKEIKSNEVEITINPQPTITTQPLSTQSICVGGTIAKPLSVSVSGGTGIAKYQWFSNVTNTTTGGTIISGAISDTYSPPSLTVAQTYNYYVEISYSQGGCNVAVSNLAQIIVVNDPVVTSQPLATQIVCQNAVAKTLSVVASGGVGTKYFYKWFSNSQNNTTNGTELTGETNDSFLPPTTTAGTIYYYCEISQDSETNCNISSSIAQVIINLAPSFKTQPNSITICVGQTPTPLKVETDSETLLPKYQWFSNAINANTGGTLISGAINASFSPPNAIATTTFYYCVVTFPTLVGSCSEIISQTAEVIVNPNPVIANTTALICSGKSFKIIPDNANGNIVPIGTTYTWTNPIIFPSGAVTGHSAQNVAQTEVSQILTNNTTSPATVTYTVIPLSGNCPGQTFNVVVTVNPAISPNVTTKNSSCFGINNGSIQTNIVGGIPFSSGLPYLISWLGPNGFTSSNATISNLEPGVYSLAISDQGGCPINEKYTITEPNDLIISTISEKDVTCFNDADGAIDISVSGGTLNYKISWTKNGTPFAVSEDLTNLSPAIYEVTVIDANNCVPKTATFTITEPQVLSVNLANKTNLLCFEIPTGTISINTTGGTAPYKYSWTGPKGFTSFNSNLTALFAGTYNLIVTDNSGCKTNLTVDLTQNPEIIIKATTTPIICYSDNNASIKIDISGGVAPYSIQWSNFGSGTFQDNLSFGDYLVTVTDALNCVKSLNINIPAPPVFSITPVVSNVSCFGDKNGSIKLNVLGGIAPVKLVWDDNPIAGADRNNLGPGTYSVTITDAKPCTIKKTFIILEPQLLVLSANITNAFDCKDTNTGAINLLVSGGSAPFTYVWSNGATSKDLSNISAGNYLVTVTDANGCVKQANYSVTRPLPIVADVVTKTDFDCSTKTVTQTFVAKASGGVPPYQLTWSSGNVSGIDNEMMNTTQNGTVVLNVKDKLGCETDYTFEVKTPKLGFPSFDSNSFAFSNFGNYSIADDIQFTNTSTEDFESIVWDFGDGITSTEINPIHRYSIAKEYEITQTVTYPFGCVYVFKKKIMVGKGYVLVVPTAFTPNKDGFNDAFRPVTKGLTNIKLDIYDTWGALIFSESGNVIKGWDGKIKNANAENGNYYFKVSGETFYKTIVTENKPFVLFK